MNHIYESQGFVNTFHATNPKTGEVYPCDEQGYIAQKAGDEVVFECDKHGKNVGLNTLVISAKTTAKLYVNDNEVYPFHIAAGNTKGFQYLRVYKIKAINDCTIYCEGLY